MTGRNFEKDRRRRERHERARVERQSRLGPQTRRGAAPPTARQLTRLRALADELGRPMPDPRNRLAASVEIDRLQQLAAAKKHNGA